MTLVRDMGGDPGYELKVVARRQMKLDCEVGATLPENATYTLTADGLGGERPAYTLCLDLLDIDGTLSYGGFLMQMMTLLILDMYGVMTAQMPG